MRNKTEAERWFQEALEFLKIGERNFQEGMYIAAVHYAQLAIEKAAKAIIALVAEPKWTHDPGGELKKLFPDEIALHELADYASESAPWHGWSTYGKYEENRRISPIEICTQPAASRRLDQVAGGDTCG